MHLARALAQEPGCLVLDEATKHLHVRHQFALLELLTALPTTAVVSLHDLPLAARHCDAVRRVGRRPGGRRRGRRPTP